MCGHCDPGRGAQSTLYTLLLPMLYAGGAIGFDKRDFVVKAQDRGRSVLLEYVSPDGEEVRQGTRVLL